VWERAKLPFLHYFGAIEDFGPTQETFLADTNLGRISRNNFWLAPVRCNVTSDADIFTKISHLRTTEIRAILWPDDYGEQPDLPATVVEPFGAVV
jgi:hypothetical protein